MNTRAAYEFTLLLDGPDVLSAGVFSALGEACEDAVFGCRGGMQFADFERESASLEGAVASAIRDVEDAVDGLRVMRVQPDELVTAAAIAERVGRTPQSINQLASGTRRSAAAPFPAPVGWVDAKTRLWRWSDVAEWFAVTTGEASDDDLATAEFMAMLNGQLESRRHHERLARLSKPRAEQAIRALARLMPSTSRADGYAGTSAGQ